jgi:hypothetical protein
MKEALNRVYNMKDEDYIPYDFRGSMTLSDFSNAYFNRNVKEKSAGSGHIYFFLFF